MDVILLTDVEKVGLRGDVVAVADGYARNFLLPRKLAERATAGKVAELERIEARRARHEAATADQAQQIAGVLEQTVLRFDVKAGPTGVLFGSVTATNVVDELWNTKKVRVDRRKVDMDTIKRIGRYEIPIEIFDGVTATVRAEVVPEGGELPPEEELQAMVAAEEAAAAEAVAAATETAPPAALEEEVVLDGGAVLEDAGPDAERAEADSKRAEPEAPAE